MEIFLGNLWLSYIINFSLELGEYTTMMVFSMCKVYLILTCMKGLSNCFCFRVNTLEGCKKVGLPFLQNYSIEIFISLAF